MKKTIFVLFIILLANSIYSQDCEPDKWTFRWGGLPDVDRFFDPDSFPQTQFYTGFEYSGDARMNVFLKNNGNVHIFV